MMDTELINSRIHISYYV